MRINIEEIDNQTILAHVEYGGVALELVAELVMDGKIMVARGVHIQGPGKNRLGWPRLRGLAEDLMEKLELDELRIEGATRTSGAGPGRNPQPLVFRRKGCHPDP